MQVSKRRDDITLEGIYALQKKGLTVRQIADHFKTYPTTIYRKLLNGRGSTNQAYIKMNDGTTNGRDIRGSFSRGNKRAR